MTSYSTHGSKVLPGEIESLNGNEWCGRGPGRAANDHFVTSEFAHRNVHKVLHGTCYGAMRLSEATEAPARRFMHSIIFGQPPATPTPTPPPTPPTPPATPTKR